LKARGKNESQEKQDEIKKGKIKITGNSLGKRNQSRRETT
jgi:hypothetical protein